jgi:hypothetical protein
MKRIISGITVILLLMSMLTLTFNIQPAKAAPATIIVPDNYSTIQEAVNAASAGDTIYVRNGTYNEMVTINKDSLTLVGDKQGAFINGTVSISANHVIVEEFTIIWNVTLVGMPLEPSPIVSLEDCNDTTVMDNNIGGYAVISLWEYYVQGIGVQVNFGNNDVIRNNKIHRCSESIVVSMGRNTSIISNHLETDGFPYLTLGLYFANSTIVYWNNIYGRCLPWASNTSWDDGYPSGGNYWSDYNGTDFYHGPYQNVTGSDGIGDTPYVVNVIYGNDTDHYPLMKPYGGLYDIGIVSVITSKTVVGQGCSLKITVKILNYGINTETFNLTAYANATTIGTATNVALTSRNSTTITFTWNTKGFGNGNYTIWAYASPVPGEIDTTDNTFTYGTVIVTILGDVDGDFHVTILDVVNIASIYASEKGDPNFNPNCDLNNDGKITILDVVTCTAHYGQKYP